MSSENNNKSEWVQQNIIDEPRLSDLIETYKELGFEGLRTKRIPTGLRYLYDCQSR